MCCSAQRRRRLPLLPLAPSPASTSLQQLQQQLASVPATVPLVPIGRSRRQRDLAQLPGQRNDLRLFGQHFQRNGARAMAPSLSPLVTVLLTAKSWRSGRAITPPPPAECLAGGYHVDPVARLQQVAAGRFGVDFDATAR